MQGTTKRTGQYALRVNPSSGVASWVAITTNNGFGASALLTRTAQAFYTFYFYVATLPGSTTRIACVETNSGSPVCRINITSAGVINAQGATSSSDVATVSTDTWYRADLRVTSNGTCGLAIDGGTEQTCTGNNVNQDRLSLGRFSTEANAYDIYYDDVLISNSGFPGTGEVRRLDPDGDGTYTGTWTGGSGTTFAEVDDDVPGHDSDSTYIQVPSTGDNTKRTFSLESCASAGVAGTIGSIKAYGVVRSESTSGTSSVGLKVKTGAIEPEATGGEWPTTYAAHGLVIDLDPDGGIAWTSTTVDALEVGVTALGIAQAQRCTKLALMVWCEGDTGPAAVNFTVTVNAPVTTAASVSSIPLLAPTVNAPATTAIALTSPALLSATVNAPITTAITLTSPALLAPVVNAAGVASIAITSIPLLSPVVNAAGVVSTEILSIPLLSPVVNAAATVSAEVDSPGAILFEPTINASGVASILLVSTPLLAPTVNAAGVAAVALTSIPLLAPVVNAAGVASADLRSVPLLAPVVNAGAVVSADVQSPGVVTLSVVVNAAGATDISLRTTPLLAATVAASGTGAITLTSPALLAATILAAVTANVDMQSTPLLAPAVIASGTAAAELRSSPLLLVTILGSASIEAAVLTQVAVDFAVTVAANVVVTASVVAVLYVVQPTGGVLVFDGRYGGQLVTNGRRAGALIADGRRGGVIRGS